MARSTRRALIELSSVRTHTSRPVAVIDVAAVDSWMRTPRASAADFSPHTSNAGSTSPPPLRTRRPPRYVGEPTSARMAAPSSSSLSSPKRRFRACAAARSGRWCGLVATAVFPHMCTFASIPSADRNATISSRLSRPIRTSRSISSGHIARPWPSPCVREAEMKPPFRPDAPKPMSCDSMSMMSDEGSEILASIAAQSPVRPPPTTSRSHDAGADRGAHAAGRSARWVQKGSGMASFSGSSARTEARVTRRRPHRG